MSSSCEICGVSFHNPSHETAKKHLLNVELSQMPGYMPIHATGLSEKRLRATGLVRKDAIWVSPTAIDAANALRSIAETKVPLARYKSTNPHKFSKPTDLVSEAEMQFAASLVEVTQTGVEAFHFRRASYLLDGKRKASERAGTFGKLCSPAQLLAAVTHREQCSIDISTSGLERSRFRHLGIHDGKCTDAELQKAAALTDAKKSGIPLSYFHIDQPKRKGPIWISPDEEQHASDLYDGYSIVHYIDNEHLYDF